MILANDNIISKCILIPDIEDIITEKEFECCTTEFNVEGFSFVLACVYRTPMSCYTNPFLTKLEILIEVLSERFSNVIVAGDFNINVLKKDSVYHRFCNILKMYNMEYKIDFPTRVTSQSQSAIDNFITNIHNKKLIASGIITKIADHDAQLLSIIDFLGNHKKNTIKFCRKFDSSGYDMFVKYLESEEWLDVYQATIEKKYDVFHSSFFYYFDISFPKKHLTEKSFKQLTWITNNLKDKKKELVELERIFRSSKNISIKPIIDKKKKELKRYIIKTQKDQINEKLLNSSNKVKATWNVVNSKIKKFGKATTNITLEHNGSILSDPVEVCEFFNNFFINMVDEMVLTKNNPQIIDPVQKSNQSGSETFNFTPVTEKDIKKAVLSFENKYSAGIDEIPIILIKKSINIIVKPLTHIINSSLISGIFPEKLKISKITPIFKKDNTKDVQCYRPISILPSFSKVYERIIYKQLLNFLERNNLIDNEQHGFVPGKSTITAGVEYVENIINSIDAGEKVIGIFLDLSRAFDSVCYNILLSKLEGLGIHNKELAWFSSYLENRKQYVEIQFIEYGLKSNYITKVASKQQIIKYGVPQGSILGPLLFICYLGGISKKTNISKVCLYADDTNMIISSKSQEDIEISAYIDMGIIKDFLSAHNLLLNMAKSSFISFTTKQNKQSFEPTIVIDQDLIIEKKHTKFLGLTIDKNLSWNEHVNNIFKKMSSGIYALWRLSKLCDLDALKKIYFALIHSHLNYGIIIYGATSKQNLDKILVKQKKAIRIIMHLKGSDSVKHLFCELKIPTVYSLYIIEVVKHVKKMLTTSLKDVHRYNTRHKIVTDRHKLKFYEMRADYMGKKYFSKLPKELQKESNINKFQMKIKEYFTNKALYSFEELL